jgi:hypothetical protein
MVIVTPDELCIIVGHVGWISNYRNPHGNLINMWGNIQLLYLQLVGHAGVWDYSPQVVRVIKRTKIYLCDALYSIELNIYKLIHTLIWLINW